MKGRHERIKIKGWSGSAAVWLLLVPLFVLIVLKTDFLPQVARRKLNCLTPFAKQNRIVSETVLRLILHTHSWFLIWRFN